jgi:tetratricopeptide (TPR) repeat protein
MAEHDLLELIGQHPETRLAYHKLFVAYLGQARWEDAARLENKLQANFHEKTAQVTEKMRAGFLKRSQDQRADFYAEFNNYGAAIDLIEQKPTRDFADFMKLVDLHYRSGKPETAEKMIGGLLEMNQQNHSLFNQFGEFYVKKLNRPEQALDYFERSIRIKPDQPNVQALINYLSFFAVRRHVEN